MTDGWYSPGRTERGRRGTAAEGGVNGTDMCAWCFGHRSALRYGHDVVGEQEHLSRVAVRDGASHG